MAMSRATNPEPNEDPLKRAQRTWQGISPGVAATLYELGFTLDVTGTLDRLTMPALVLHRRGSQAIPFELGRRLAAKLPDARFVPLDGEAHEPWDGDVQASLAAVADFLGVPLVLDVGAGQQAGAVTVLFTDLVDSTVRTQQLGDDPRPGNPAGPQRHRAAGVATPRRRRSEAHWRRHHGLVRIGHQRGAGRDRHAGPRQRA